MTDGLVINYEVWMKKNDIFVEYNIYNIWKKQYNRTELEYIDRGGVKIRRMFEV